MLLATLPQQIAESMQQALDQAQQRHAMSEKQHEWNTQDWGPVVSAATEAIFVINSSVVESAA